MAAQNECPTGELSIATAPLDEGASQARPSANPRWKRSLDLACLLALLPLLIPVSIAIMAWIRLRSKGPLLFRQERVGQDGRRFQMLKFRSMEVDADHGAHEAHVQDLLREGRPLTKLDTLGDRRLIPGGGFLRASGLDELPQLINVLRGEMSLVGPRPCLPIEHAHCSADQLQRFKVLPGLTGYWQVNGKNQTTFSEMLAMDAVYVQERAPWLDLRILLKTPFVLVRELRAARRARSAS